MSKIKVQYQSLGYFSENQKNLRSTVEEIGQKLGALRDALDWDVTRSSGIGGRLDGLQQKVKEYGNILLLMSDYLQNASQEYEKCENALSGLSVEENSVTDTGTIEDMVTRLAKYWDWFSPTIRTIVAADIVSYLYKNRNALNDLGNSASNFIQKYILKNYEGGDSLYSDNSEIDGKLFGYDAKLTATQNILGYDYKVENSAEFDLKKGEFGIGRHAEASGYLYKGELAETVGLLTTTATVTAVAATASGDAKCALYQDGKFNPELSVSAKAEAVGLQEETEIKYGNDKFNVRAGATGTVGIASAEAKCGISGDGVGLEAEVGAAAFKAEAKTGFTLFGIKVDLTGEAEALAVGAKVDANLTKDSVEFGGKLSVIGGLGLKLKISW